MRISGRKALSPCAVALALVLAWPLDAAVLTIRTRIWTEGPAASVELVAFPAGRSAAFDPSWPRKPLARVTGAPGSELSLPVEAPLPLRLEARTPGHVAMGLELWLPEQLPVPPVWLARGEAQTLDLSWFAAGKEVAVFSPLVPVFGWPSATLRWHPIAPSQGLSRKRTLEVRVPAKSSFPVAAVAADGSWARLDLGERRRGTVIAGTRKVRLVDTRGRPVAGAEVAQVGAPLGTASKTAADGTAVLWVSPQEEAGIVARQGSLGAFGRTEATEVELVLRPLPTARLAPARPYGPLLVWTAAGWGPLDGGFVVLPPEGGRVSLANAKDTLFVAAPGYCFASLSKPHQADEVVVRLVPSASVEGLALDGEKRPVAGVPIRVAAPQVPPISLWQRGQAVDLGVLAVSDEAGRWSVSGLVPGELRLRARQGSLVASSPTLQLGPGESRFVELVLTPGATLRATIEDPRGQPLPDVRSQVFHLEEAGVFGPETVTREAPLAEGSSDREGKLVVTGLPTGRVGVRLLRAGFATRYLAATLPASGLDMGRVVLEPGVEVSGRVVNERGEGVQDAVVELAPSPQHFSFEWCTTDTQGSFRFEGQPASGVAYLKASGRNLIPSDLTRVELPPAGPVELRVTTGLSLRGRVVEDATGEPVPGVQVQAVVPAAGGAAPRLGFFPALDTTDEEGQFVLRSLAPGTVVVQVEARGFVPVSRTVEVGANARPLLIRLAKGLEIRGRVFETNGEPAAGVGVSAQPASPRVTRGLGEVDHRASERTDSSGRFVLSGLLPGPYRVEASGFAGESDRVLVEAGAADVELHLGRLGAVEVQTADERGSPVADARVRLLGPAQVPLEGTTDAAGRTRFAELPPGSYRVDVRAEGFAGAGETVQVAGGKTVFKAMTLKRGGVVEGLVRGLGPDQLALTEVRSFHGARTTVQADGRFRLEGVPLGKEPVAARVTSTGATRSAEVVVEAGRVAWVEFDFARSLTLSGRLTRRGSPASGFSVRARVADRATWAEDITDANGEFHLRELEEGTLRLTVRDPSGQVVLLHTTELHAEQRVNLEIPGATLTGQVIAQGSGEPVSQATVTLALLSGGYAERVARTLEDGSFVFRDLPGGRFRLMVAASGYAPAEEELELGENQSKELEVSLRPEAALRVEVREAEGSFPEAVGLLAGQAGKPPVWQWVELDRLGRGVVATLAPGSYLGVWRSTGAAVVPFTVPGKLSVQLQPAGRLEIAGAAGGEVLVILADGTTLPPWAAPLATPDGWTRVPSWSNPRLTLPAGDYLVRLRRPGQVREKRVQVRAGAETSVDFKE